MSLLHLCEHFILKKAHRILNDPTYPLRLKFWGSMRSNSKILQLNIRITRHSSFLFVTVILLLPIKVVSLEREGRETYFRWIFQYSLLQSWMWVCCPSMTRWVSTQLQNKRFPMKTKIADSLPEKCDKWWSWRTWWQSKQNGLITSRRNTFNANHQRIFLPVLTTVNHFCGFETLSCSGFAPSVPQKQSRISKAW